MNNTILLHPFFVIMGPSGSGKTKVTAAVFSKEHKVISYTTRLKRPEEKDGEDYYFVSFNRFKQLIQDQALVEYDMYNGHFYGVGVKEILFKTAKHYAYDVLTYKGFEAIEARFGNQVLPIFFDASHETIHERLKDREETKVSLQERLALYEQDIDRKEQLKKYTNHYILNADLPFDEVVSQLENIVSVQLDK